MAVEAKEISTRVDDTHYHGGKPAFEAVLGDIIAAEKITGTSRELRRLFRQINHEAKSHAWLSHEKYVRARAKIIKSHRLLARKGRPLPSNINNCLC